MSKRLHPLVWITILLTAVCAAAVAIPVSRGNVPPEVAFQPWYSQAKAVFYTGAGRRVVSLFGIAAALAGTLFRFEGREYAIAKWTWGTIAMSAFALLSVHWVQEALRRAFGS